MFAPRLSIKWLKRASSKLNKPFCLPCKGRWVQLVALGGIEKQLGHRVQAIFGAFRLLLGGVNCAKHKRHEAPNSFMNLAETVRCTVSQQVRIKQLPLTKDKIYLTFSKSICVIYHSLFVYDLIMLVIKLSLKNPLPLPPLYWS